MRPLLQVLIRKHPLILSCILIYLLVVGLIKWQLAPPLAALLFLIGGGLGIYFVDLAEVIFALHPSPFRTILFQTLFVAVSFFVITSSGSMIASGLVLSIYLGMILTQAGELQIRKNLNSWYEVIAVNVSPERQRQILIIIALLFIFLTYLFVR